MDKDPAANSKERKRRRLAAIALVLIVASLVCCAVAVMLAPTVSEDALPADVPRPEMGAMTPSSRHRFSRHAAEFRSLAGRT